MFSEILKVIPKVDPAALAKMTRTLNTRFGLVAKKFAGGIKTLLTGGAVGGAVIALMDRILNPLKEVQEAIDRTLKDADDLVTNAKQFNTTEGKLFKLRTFAKATGLAPEDLNTLMVKYQTALAEAAADPTKAGTLKQFVGDKDIGDSFLSFIESLKAMTKTNPTGATLVQKEVFGEKQILKMADFLQSDFGELNRKLRLGGSEEYTPRIQRGGKINDFADELRAGVDAQDFGRKLDTIQPKMIGDIVASEQRAQQKLNQDIQNFNNLKALQNTADEVTYLLRDLNKVLGAGLVELLKMAKARGVRGIGKTGD